MTIRRIRHVLAAAIVVALLGGQVDLLCDQTTQTVPHIKPNSIKLYGVTTPARIKVLPRAPTMEEQGLKGFQVVVWHGVYAPKGTPRDVVEKLQAAVRAAVKDAGSQQRMTDLGAEIVPDAKLTTEGLKGWLQAETDRYAPMIRQADAYAD